MTPEEKLKIFKDITRSYPKYLDHIQGLDDKLEELNTKMENVHSINFENERTAGSRQDRPIIEMIESKTKLEKEKQYYLDMIGWMNSVFDSFESSAIKALVWMTYIQRKSLSSIAEEFLISKDNLYKIRRKYVIRVLTDEKMAELEDIQNSYSAENALN